MVRTQAPVRSRRRDDSTLPVKSLRHSDENLTRIIPFAADIPTSSGKKTIKKRASHLAHETSAKEAWRHATIAKSEAVVARKEAQEAWADAANARTDAMNAKAVAALCAAALGGAKQRSDNNNLEMKALVQAAMLSEDAASRSEEKRLAEVTALGQEISELKKFVATVREDRAAAAAAFASAAARIRTLEVERHKYFAQAADAVEAAAAIAARVVEAEKRASSAEDALCAERAASAARLAQLETC